MKNSDLQDELSASAGHAEEGYSDVSHGDVAHGDVAHGDVAHGGSIAVAKIFKGNTLAKIQKTATNGVQYPPLLQHLAIIMDGNGRWAKARGKSRIFGHRAGGDAAKKILEYALDVGIPYLTLFAFSSENWRRPKHEVEALMRLLEEYLDNNREKFLAGERVRLHVFGDKQGLPESLRKKLQEVEKKSIDNVGLDLGLALNYGGRAEILRATKKLVEKCLRGDEKTENIDEDTLASLLDTAEFPDPDLLLRTGGEKRISNFMLWQSAYTEMIFTDCPWPDFDAEKLEKILVKFSARVRRFGASPEAENEQARA